MSHEPECQPHGYYTCTCDELRAAYQRGREDVMQELHISLRAEYGGKQ